MQDPACNAVIAFGDDYIITFHCDLFKNHQEPHEESGWNPQHYVIVWDNKSHMKKAKGI